jgi:hypothetical protein
MGAKLQAALHPKHGRQRARDQQAVVKPILKKGKRAVRLDDPAIQRIQSAANEKKRIEAVTKSPHSNARMIKPNPNANKTLSRIIFERITGIILTRPPSSVQRQTLFKINPFFTMKNSKVTQGKKGEIPEKIPKSSFVFFCGNKFWFEAAGSAALRDASRALHDRFFFFPYFVFFVPFVVKIPTAI